MTPTSLVAYLVLFAGGAFAFLLVTLGIGWFLRARVPTAEKLRPYECGEPSVGTSDVQFDLRFYVVALVFLIFDVEVAFFFPWATVYGKATQIAHLAAVGQSALPDEAPAIRAAIDQKYRELAGRALQDASITSGDFSETRQQAHRLALFSLLDLGVFFAVLLVGFAYVWNQGDLDWVRSVIRRAAGERESSPMETLQP